MRTYGDTKDCKGCRFWSEMMAEVRGGVLRAMCLGDGLFKMKYTAERQTCDAWKSGHFGAIDEPPDYGKETRAAYASEEASSHE